MGLKLTQSIKFGMDASAFSDPSCRSNQVFEQVADNQINWQELCNSDEGVQSDCAGFESCDIGNKKTEDLSEDGASEWTWMCLVHDGTTAPITSD